MQAFIQAFLKASPGREDNARRALVLLTAVFLGVLWLFFALWAYEHRQETAASGARQMDQHRLAVELEVRGNFKPVQIFLLLANRWVADHPERDPRQDGTFAEMTRQFQAATRSTMICLVDKHGIATAVSKPASHPPRDVSDEEYLEGALAQGPGRIYLGVPYLDQADQTWKLPVVFTLTQSSAKLTALVAHMALHPLIATLSERTYSPGSNIMLFRRDGVLLAETPSEPWRVGQSFSASPLFKDGIHKEIASAVLKDQDLPAGSSWIAYGGTTEFPLVAAISQDSSDIFQEWRRDVAIMFFLLLLASAATLLVAYRAIMLLKDLEDSRESLRVMAITDSLTGLFNRRHFYELAENEWIRAQRYSRPLSLIIIDIDLFKLVNDTHGHGIGDEVLKNVANVCRAKLRDQDVMCRLGGEEFSIMLPETPLEGALQLAERLRAAVGAMVTQVVGQKVTVTISAGVAQTNGDDEGFAALDRRADNALYQAKEAGRNRVCQG